MTKPSLTQRLLEATDAHFDDSGCETIDANELLEAMLFITEQILAASPMQLREAWVQRIANEFPREVEEQRADFVRRGVIKE